MRHRKTGRSFSRFASQRKALFKSLAISLIEHGIIRTTLPKAKELRMFLEPLITRAKVDSLANRRIVFNRLRNRDSVTRLFNELGPRYNTRMGGYTRILKCGFRPGDCAPQAFIELVDRPDAPGAEEAAA